MVSGEILLLRHTTDQRVGNERIVDLHACETDMSRTHVNHLYRPADSRRWHQPKASVSISGGSREMGRLSLIAEEIREVAVQRVSVNSQDEVVCLGSCCLYQGYNNGRHTESGVHVDRCAATLGARRLRHENPHPSNDWGTLPVGDEPENTKDRHHVTRVLAVRNERTNT
jgi:hypothetical protein